MSSFSDERAWTRESSSIGQQKVTKPRDPQFDPYAGIPKYTGSTLLAAGSIVLGGLSLDRSRSGATRAAAGVGSLVTGTLALSSALTRIKGDN